MHPPTNARAVVGIVCRHSRSHSGCRMHYIRIPCGRRRGGTVFSGTCYAHAIDFSSKYFGLRNDEHTQPTYSQQCAMRGKLNIRPVESYSTRTVPPANRSHRHYFVGEGVWCIIQNNRRLSQKSLRSMSVAGCVCALWLGSSRALIKFVQNIRVLYTNIVNAVKTRYAITVTL